MIMTQVKSLHKHPSQISNVLAAEQDDFYHEQLKLSLRCQERRHQRLWSVLGLTID